MIWAIFGSILLVLIAYLIYDNYHIEFKYFEQKSSFNLTICQISDLHSRKLNVGLIVKMIEKYKPDVCAIEKLFFFRNQTTVMPVAHARGVILTVLEKFGIPIYEYTPMEVKQILTGYGRASKKEVEQMVKIALESEKLPKLDDTVDSIAIAISYTRSPDALEDLKKFEF